MSEIRDAMQAHMDTVRGSSPADWCDAKDIDSDELEAEAYKIGRAAAEQMEKAGVPVERAARNAFKVGFASAWTMLERRGLGGATADNRDTEADS